MAILALRIVLGLTGLTVICLGINVGFGGIRTLGWQGGTDFMIVTHPDLFAVRDSHVRFLGGVWLGLGTILCAAGIWPVRLRPIVLATIWMVVLGGLTRWASTDVDALTGPPVLGPLLLELIAFPILAFWVCKAIPRT